MVRIHLPPPFKKLTHLVRGAFLFFMRGGGRRSRAARSDAGVGPPGSTARSDVRERSEGNPPPIIFEIRYRNLLVDKQKKTLFQNFVLTAFFIYRSAARTHLAMGVDSLRVVALRFSCPGIAPANHKQPPSGRTIQQPLAGRAFSPTDRRRSNQRCL